jgi:hypothetical protein
MKVYRGIRGIDPLVLNFGTRWSGQLHSQAVLQPGRNRGTLLISWVGPGCRSALFSGESNVQIPHWEAVCVEPKATEAQMKVHPVKAAPILDDCHIDTLDILQGPRHLRAHTSWLRSGGWGVGVVVQVGKSNWIFNARQGYIRNLCLSIPTWLCHDFYCNAWKTP